MSKVTQNQMHLLYTGNGTYQGCTDCFKHEGEAHERYCKYSNMWRKRRFKIGQIYTARLPRDNDSWCFLILAKDYRWSSNPDECGTVWLAAKAGYIDGNWTVRDIYIFDAYGREIDNGMNNGNDLMGFYITRISRMKPDTQNCWQGAGA